MSTEPAAVQSIRFAGMSGSAFADAAGAGRMMQKMMTEGAAGAALSAPPVSAPLYRSVNASSLYASLLSSARTAASIGMLIAAAIVFNVVTATVTLAPDLSLWLPRPFDCKG